MKKSDIPWDIRKLAISKKYREANREKVREASRKHRIKTKESNWINRVVSAAKMRCKKTNLEFKLSVKDLLLPDICPVLGIPISINSEKDFRPSLDRIDNFKGYTKENVRIISMRANRIKSDSTLEELKKLVSYIEANIG